MRLAWLLSLGIHATLVGVFVLQPFGGGLTPPRAGMARIGVVSEESVRFESTTLPEITEPDEDAPEALPAAALTLPLVAPHAPVTPPSSPLIERVRPRRVPHAFLSSTDVSPAPSAAAVRSDGAMAPPSPSANPEPRYPAEARRRGWQGLVLLLARVGADGACIDARVLASSGHRCLDDAALDAVCRWTFSPATRDRVPIEAEVEVPVNFVLR